MVLPTRGLGRITVTWMLLGATAALSDGRANLPRATNEPLASEDPAPTSSLVVCIVGQLQAVEEALEDCLVREYGMSARRLPASELPAHTADVILIVQRDLHEMDLLRATRQACPLTPTVMLTAQLSPLTYGRAFDHGASGILDLEMDLPSIAAGLRKASNGEPVRDVDYTLQMLLEGSRDQLRRMQLLRTTERLTIREREILQALADGLSGPEVAAQLMISPNTVRNHISNVLVKLGVRSQLQAVLLAGAAGLVAMPDAPPDTQPAAPRGAAHRSTMR